MTFYVKMFFLSFFTLYSKYQRMIKLSHSFLGEAMAKEITDIPGIKIGCVTDIDAATGCTVVFAEKGAVAGVDVRGGAPGTREIAALLPGTAVPKINAVYLGGGSAYGLEGAFGVMQALEEHSTGFQTGPAVIPVVPGAIIFDLGIGSSDVRPDKKMGYRACTNALKSLPGGEVPQGNAGAGTGATVGKIISVEQSMKGGQGTACYKTGDLIVGALVIVNCFGDVIDHHTGRIVAGALNSDGDGFVGTCNTLIRSSNIADPFNLGGGAAVTNTTIGVIVTNASLSKALASRVALMAHDGFARAINPIHTLFDGDTIFCLSTGEVEADCNIVGALAAEVMAEAIVNGVKAADSLFGFRSYKELEN
jgi:L-aminopeptidase/D-esterase-like protein